MNGYRKFLFYFFVLFLTGCQIKTRTVKVERMNENEGRISIQYADVVQPNDTSDVGAPWEAVITNNTVFEDENGNTKTIESLSFKSRIKIL